MAYFYWTHNFNRNCHILHRNCYCTYFKFYVGWRAECYKFFLFFCMSLGDEEKQWQVWLQESNIPTPLPAPNVDLLCTKPVFWHGIMDRLWLQRKMTDTLTTHRNFFYKTPRPQNKQNILLPWVGWWSQREGWEKVLAQTLNHPHHHPLHLLHLHPHLHLHLPLPLPHQYLPDPPLHHRHHHHHLPHPPCQGPSSIAAG